MSSEHDFQNDIQVRTDERADGFVFRSELLLVWDLSLSLSLSLSHSSFTMQEYPSRLETPFYFAKTIISLRDSTQQQQPYHELCVGRRKQAEQLVPVCLSSEPIVTEHSLGKQGFKNSSAAL
jgi:hypothetical protein